MDVQNYGLIHSPEPSVVKSIKEDIVVIWAGHKDYVVSTAVFAGTSEEAKEDVMLYLLTEYVEVSQ